MSLSFFADHCVPAVVIRLLRDDNLRNHGFLWGENGWRLADAFDMNPSIDRREHVLTIDGLIADPDIEQAVATASFYGVNDGRACEIVDNTRAIVSTWNKRAQAGNRRRRHRAHRVCFFRTRLRRRRSPMIMRFIGALKPVAQPPAD